MKIKQIIINLLSNFALVGVFVLSSFSFFNTRYSKKTAYLTVFDSVCKSNDAEYYFANISIPGDAKDKVHEKVFFSNYSKNFSGTSTRLLSVSGPNGLASFKTSFNDIEFPYLTNPVSGINYTNSEDECRLETVDLNIYKYLPRSIEHSFDKEIYDGFVYIPDYYADFIIENSNSIKTYDDLLNDDQKNVFSLHYNERTFKYKIANIFNVNGFDNNYSLNDIERHNDFSNGKKLNMLFDGFAFVSNYDHFTLFDDRFFTTLVLQIGSKKFELEENILIADSFNSKKNESPTQAELFYYGKGIIHSYEKSNELVNSFFEKNEEGINLLYFSILIVLMNLFIIVYLLNFFSVFGFERNPLYYLVSFIVCSAYLLISFLVKAILKTEVFIYQFFNPYVSMIIIFVLLCSLISYIFIGVKREK